MMSSRVYRLALRLLPEAVRARAGEELAQVCAARLAEVRGVRRVHALLHELWGVVLLAAASRRGALRNEPTRRTLLSELMQDLHFAGRSMRRAPGVAVLAVVTLALGVGASVAMFSVVDGVVLRPLPFERPEQLMFVHPTIEDWRDEPELASGADRGQFSEGELAQWLERQQSFESAAGLGGGTTRVQRGAGSELVATAHATRGVFAMLAVEPLLGRLFDVDVPESEPVVVLSHAEWTEHHGGDRGIIGRDILLNDEPVRVIGVLPEWFALPRVNARIWRPLEVSSAGQLDSHQYRAIGRLRDGVSRSAAEAESAALLASITAERPDHLTHHARLVPPLQDVTEPLRTPLLILGGACLLLLLGACANVALLLLGAGADRVRELAVRRALGAARSRIARQLLTESVVLSSVGAAAGLGVAALVVQALVRLAPDGLPRVDQVTIAPRTFAVAAALAMLTGIVVGCFPALSLSRVSATTALRSGATAAGRNRLQGAIVVVQLAVATLLLVGAGLLTRTMQELQRVQTGFAADGLVTMKVTLPFDRFVQREGEYDEAGYNRLAASLHRALQDVPGTEVAFTSDMPFSGDRGTNAIQPEGYVSPDGDDPSAARRFVSGNYFDVMQIEMLQGRPLTEADMQPGAERVMVVTDRFARFFWGDGRWLDRKVGFWQQSYRVVGIIADTREHDLRGDEDAHKFYVAGRDNVVGNVIARSRLPESAVVQALSERVWRTDPALVITEVATMRERIDASIANFRYRMRLMAAFSIISAAFCLLGIYGVMNRSVARRRQELGIRMALGAERRRILQLVLRDGVRLGIAGAALGLLLALASTRVLESQLWGVPATDPVTFAAIAALLLVLALAASLVPARRAAAVEPLTTLR